MAEAANSEPGPMCSVRDACLSAGRPCGMASWCSTSSFRLLSLNRGEKTLLDASEPMRLRTLRSGLLAHCGTLADGRRQIYCMTAPGEALCSARMAGMDTWVEALADTVICELTPGTDIQPGNGLYEALVAARGERLAAAFRHIVMLGQLNAVERVRTFLADMVHRLGRRDPDGWHLTLPLSREDIGDYLGLNAESVSRALREVKRSGHAEFATPTQVRVADLDRLAGAGMPGMRPPVPALEGCPQESRFKT